MKTISKHMNAISLFSGAMGLDLGIERAGFRIRVCNEIDPIFAETIRLNTETPIICRDVNDVTAEDLLLAGGLKKEEVDLIFGGPPCQAFSTAGARRSLRDTRGNAILSFLRLVKDIKPKTFLLENVRGLLYAKIDFIPEGFDEKKYRHVLGKKGGLIYFLYKEFGDLGYNVSFALFDSANYGVPQKRERILMFGTSLKNEIQLPKPTHSKDGVIGKKWVSIKEAFTGLKEEKMEYVELRDKHKNFLKKLKAGQYWKHLGIEDQKKALGGAYKLQGGKTGFFRRLAWEKPSPTILTSPIMPATMLCHPDKLRPLSVQEYARIQQFPDDWIFAGKLPQRYKQIGNAVPVGLGYAAGMALNSHIAGELGGKNNQGDRYSRYNDTDHKTFIGKFDLVTVGMSI
ncbi:MAG: DNA cytosine methyltransferase [Patescibacteria group bacterium]